MTSLRIFYKKSRYELDLICLLKVVSSFLIKILPFIVGLPCRCRIFYNDPCVVSLTVGHSRSVNVSCFRIKKREKRD